MDVPHEQLLAIVRECESTKNRIHSLCRIAWHSAFEIGECLVSFIASKLFSDDFICDIQELKLLAETDITEMDGILGIVSENHRVFEIRL